MTHIDFDSGAGTMVGITVGAALATLGGLLAGQFEHHLHRIERQKSAALLFGEILAALKLILRLADEARGRGDPYGPITMRTLRAAQRETQIYDRNRETLFDVRDAALRARTHLLLLQIGLTLDSVFEAAGVIENVVAVEGPAADGGRAAAAIAGREGGFDFLMGFRPQLPELIARYEKIAHQKFDAHDLVLQGTAGPQAAQAANA